MKQTVYQVQVRVFLKELQKYYEDNPDYGTVEKPYPADSFHQVICPYATFYGPLKNIMLYDANCTYVWSIESADGSVVSFASNENSGMELEMIDPDPTNAKWKKIFEDAPEMDPKTKKVKVKPKKKGKDVFELSTAADATPSAKFKFSFLFEFTDASGALKYGIIDPDGSLKPPPPPEYP